VRGGAGQPEQTSLSVDAVSCEAGTSTSSGVDARRVICHIALQPRDVELEPFDQMLICQYSNVDGVECRRYGWKCKRSGRDGVTICALLCFALFLRCGALAL
jgi:hypothetical protein